MQCDRRSIRLGRGEHMIKLIIFDLDGVLVDSKDMHFECLNAAITEVAPEFVISLADHTSNFDGLPTTVKLTKLAARGLDPSLMALVKARKQNYTTEYVSRRVVVSHELVRLFRFL